MCISNVLLRRASKPCRNETKCWRRGLFRKDACFWKSNSKWKTKPPNLKRSSHTSASRHTSPEGPRRHQLRTSSYNLGTEEPPQKTGTKINVELPSFSLLIRAKSIPMSTARDRNTALPLIHSYINKDVTSKGLSTSKANSLLCEQSTDWL